MLNQIQIDEICQTIRDGLDPLKIVLFGSYAAGRQTEGSDLDLLVVARTELEGPRRYAQVRRLLKDYPSAFDLVVKTPEEYARLRTVVNNIVYFADKYGKVIYER